MRDFDLVTMWWDPIKDSGAMGFSTVVALG